MGPERKRRVSSKSLRFPTWARVDKWHWLGRKSIMSFKILWQNLNKDTKHALDTRSWDSKDWYRIMKNIYEWLAYTSGEGNGTPLQYSCLENPMDGGAWWAAVHGVEKSQTRLSDFTFTFHFHALEEEMATHSSVLAWRIPGMGEPGGLPSMESQSRTWLKWLSSSSNSSIHKAQLCIFYYLVFIILIIIKRMNKS